jgi:hypothetical protein
VAAQNGQARAQSLLRLHGGLSIGGCRPAAR